jgi:ceramide glucosyltransferase
MLTSASFGAVLFLLAAIGLVALAVQHVTLRLHLRHPRPAPGGAREQPPVSILKPLCGADDELEANLASFAALDYPLYEVVLGVRSPRDPAFAVARAALRRWPDRMRLVVQRYDEGRNPKVNQLVGLARAARHPVLVVSDSNVRVEPGYLAEIARELADPRVGLVTHPVAGTGERRLGSVLENLHLAGSVGPAIVATHRLVHREIVVGKSMALRREDLRALGGFEAVKDVLAEDHILGLWVRTRLRKRVRVATRPVWNVNRDRSVREFWGRYARWSVLQRQLVGAPTYAAQLMLNPVLLALAGLLADRGADALLAFGLVCALKIAIDGASARALRGRGFPLRHLLLVPVKDLLVGVAVLQGFLVDEVSWRGNRLRVLPGTRLAPVLDGEEERPAVAEA